MARRAAGLRALRTPPPRLTAPSLPPPPLLRPPGIVCSDNCKCLDCKNYEGSEAREALVSAQGDRGGSAGGSPMGLRRSASRGMSLGISPTAAAPLAALPVPRAGFASPGAQAAAAAAAAGLPSLAALQAAPRPLTNEERQQMAREAVKEVRLGPGVEERASVGQ